MGEDINPQQALWQIPPTTIASLKHHHGLRAGGYSQPHRRPTALHLPLPNPLVRFKGASGIDIARGDHTPPVVWPWPPVTALFAIGAMKSNSSKSPTPAVPASKGFKNRATPIWLKDG